MKDKIIKIAFALFSLLIMMTNVDAKVANAPSTLPDDGTKIYALIDSETFDFSKIKFGTVSGYSTMNKIFMSVTPQKGAESDTIDKVLGNDYFAAYCLDGNLQYPQHNVTNLSVNSLDNNSDKMLALIEYEIYNNKDIASLISKYAGQQINSVDYSYSGTYDNDSAYTSLTSTSPSIVTVHINKIEFANYSTGAIEPLLTEVPIDKDIQLTFNDLKINNYTTGTDDTTYNHALWIVEHSYPTLSLEQTYELAGASYERALAELYIILKTDITLRQAGGTYNYTYAQAAMNTEECDLISCSLAGNCNDTSKCNKSTTLDNLETSVIAIMDCGNDKISDSDKATYYPLIAAGLNEQLGSTGVSELTGGTKTELSQSDINPNVCKAVIQYFEDQTGLEDYTYSTVQYAIWKTTNKAVGGVTLGDTLTGSETLNTLYQYLIKDRSEYTNYDKITYDKNIKFNTPTKGKEIYKDDKETYVYGPYSVDYDMVYIKSGLSVSLSGDSSNTSQIVDKDLKKVSKVTAGQQFYIKTNKSQKIANLKLTVSTKEAYSFFPSSNRARIYTAYSPLLQNTISGGKITKEEISQSFDLVFNAKTGVESLIVLFIVVLISFSLGYIVLNHRNKPIEL